MAITGNSEQIGVTNVGQTINANDFVNSVGNLQGSTIDKDAYNKMRNMEAKMGGTNLPSFNDATVKGNNVNYLLKGKAGITANFYSAFSGAFDSYKGVIKRHLDGLETNPNIKQAFTGTDLEAAVKKLILAVQQEANDYLFKLEQAEKNVIFQVQQAFQKQQSKMSTSMNSDTSNLSKGNSSAEQIDKFAKMDADRIGGK